MLNTSQIYFCIVFIVLFVLTFYIIYLNRKLDHYYYCNSVSTFSGSDNCTCCHCMSLSIPKELCEGR